MNENIRERPTLIIKKNEALPEGADVLEISKKGNRTIYYPIKFTPITNKKGRIVGWQRRPREDFI